MGALTADPIALPVSCPSALAHIDIASHSPCHFNFSNQAIGIETVGSISWCDYTHPKFGSSANLNIHLYCLMLDGV